MLVEYQTVYLLLPVGKFRFGPRDEQRNVVGIRRDVNMPFLGTAAQVVEQGRHVALFVLGVHLEDENVVGTQHLCLAFRTKPKAGKTLNYVI